MMKKFFIMAAFMTGLLLAGCNGGQKEGGNSTATAEDHGEIVPVENDSTAAGQQEAEEEEDLGYNPEVLKTGAPAPAIKLKDVNGNELSLTDLKGKHLVIDFWGTWCPWCVVGIPEMKKAYDKYSDKMEILSVDCGDAEDDWKDAVKEHEMNWKNVHDSEKKTSELYELQGFPTKIVLDPDGNILKVFVGEGEEFYQYLDSLFK